MLTEESRFTPDPIECVGKVIDGEAIVINVTNGVYYSMNSVGTFIWELLAEGRSLDESADLVAARYEVERETAFEDLKRLAAELVDEKILVLAPDARPGEPHRVMAGDPLPYTSPELNIYRDMSALLALDPPMPRLKDTPWKKA